MGYVYLAIAIIAEVVATSMLKASEEFTKPIPSIIVIVGYGVAFYSLSLVLRTVPMGVAYAIWSGVGMILVAFVGYIFYDQKLDMAATIGMLLIVSGVIVINIFSKTMEH